MNIYAKCLHPYIDKNGFAYGCGHCVTCRRSKTIEWNMRASHELITNKKATYITLSYRNKDLIKTAKYKINSKDMQGTLVRKHMTDFIKRLRKYIENTNNKLIKNKKIRYIYCGEYGPNTHRPHYHMIIFGINYNEISQDTYKKLWTKGHVDKSNEYVTEYCIAYISGYIRKKEKYYKEDYYYKNNNRLPPYLQTSEGIGKEWAIKNAKHWTKTLKIGYRNYQLPVPRYYLKTIFKQEGRTIKYYKNYYKLSKNLHKLEKIYKLIEIFNAKIIKMNIPLTYIKCPEDKKTYYKIIENPEGNFTKLIRLLQIKNLIESSKTWKNNYKITSKQSEDILNLYKKKLNKINVNKNIEYYETEGSTDQYLTERYTTTAVKNGPALIKYNNKNKSNISESISKRLKSIAKLKEYKNNHGAYGKRDIIELQDISDNYE